MATITFPTGSDIAILAPRRKAARLRRSAFIT